VFPQSKHSTSGRAGDRIKEEGILLVDSVVLTRRVEKKKLVEPTLYLIKNRKIAGFAASLLERGRWEGVRLGNCIYICGYAIK
jgi:hypothetical protein